MNKNKISLLITTILIINLLGCSKDDSGVEEINSTSWTITVGAFSLNNGIFTALGNELIFDSKEECQVWSRTAQGDNHNSNSHLHYNAAADVSYDNNLIIFSWTEYGPEITQASIENTCSDGVNGVSKVVNDYNYYQDKPNVYLKITNVVEN
ncbi:hypothetical protein OAG16_02355 [Saprospiraceae bacterium]|nr:hypothetical protein [Saprospiraceae bacterium]MDB4768897.1 hypothetical protein [Saprospiraceae bacterium]MDC3253562.1 hypothetical protein [bacterium]MDG1434829.1 hypothetical protein [Saprospiraceae bacterium]